MPVTLWVYVRVVAKEPESTKFYTAGVGGSVKCVEETDPEVQTSPKRLEKGSVNK